MDLNLCSGQVNMQLCGFHCIPGYSISVFYHYYQYFIHFTCLRVVSRDFLKTRFTKCAQIWFILIISACTTTVQYRMVYFVPFHSFWPFNSKLGSTYSFQLSGGLAPWQCCYVLLLWFVITLELVLIDWNWIPLIQLNYWCLRVDNSTWTSLLRCL